MTESKKTKAKPLVKAKTKPVTVREKPVKPAAKQSKTEIPVKAVARLKSKSVKTVEAGVRRKAPVKRKEAVEEVLKPRAVIPPVVPVGQKVMLEPAVKEAEVSKPQEKTQVKPQVAPVEKKLKEIKPKEKIPELHVKTSAPEQAPPPAAAVPQPPVSHLKPLELKLPVTVKDLSVKLQEKPSVVIKALMDMRIMAGINQALEESVVQKVCEKYGFTIQVAPSEEEAMLRFHQEPDAAEVLKTRSPVVTLMGHVDHGKTSLLDAIRKSKVTESEHGGITQHIGAYRVRLPHGEITFLDTPGHEAFTAMRARGAKITDIVVLVIAAEEGIMPQTQEAIDHARAAGVTIIVALNKVDKPSADVDRVKKQLSECNLMAEDWGGQTITVPVSAKTGKGIDELLEMILLQAQMLDLKANPEKLARGVVIEAKSHKNKGPVVTLLVQNGTLRLNEHIIVGSLYGKIRAMFNDHGQAVTSAGPSIPVEIMGISGLPQAGEPFFVISDEKLAKELALTRQEHVRQEQLKPVKRFGLEDLYAQIKEGKLKELNLIIKADAHGSSEAIKDVLGKIDISGVAINTIHEGVGNVNMSDVILAVASNALILGFNVVVEESAKELIAKEGQEVRTYNIIYELANDIKAALEGMLEPKIKKVFLGKVEIRKVLKLSKGIIAGCFVAKGKIFRNSLVRLVRNGETAFEGELSTLKRFKDDVREVGEGYECGLTIKGFDSIMEGDILEAYVIEKIARKI